MRKMILLALVLGMVLSTVAPGVVADDHHPSPPCRPYCEEILQITDGADDDLPDALDDIGTNWPPCRPRC